MSTNPFKRHFDHAHLPPNLQAVVYPYAELANWVCDGPRDFDGEEGAVGLRKLVEAKDAAVRAALWSGTWDETEDDRRRDASAFYDEAEHYLGRWPRMTEGAVREVAQAVHDIAGGLFSLPACRMRTLALHRLIEAKDALVRAAMWAQEDADRKAELEERLAALTGPARLNEPAEGEAPPSPPKGVGLDAVREALRIADRDTPVFRDAKNELEAAEAELARLRAPAEPCPRLNGARECPDFPNVCRCDERAALARLDVTTRAMLQREAQAAAPLEEQETLDNPKA